MKDANQIAAEHERRERVTPTGPAWTAPQVVRGTLTIWEEVDGGGQWLTQSLRTHIDLSKPGLLVAYAENGDAEVFVLKPGWYINFTPDREE